MTLSRYPLLAALLLFSLAPAPAGAQDRTGTTPGGTAYRVSVLADGLHYPWSAASLPDGRLLVTERGSADQPGRLRVIRNGGLVGQPVSGVPAVLTGGQGGLFDVLTHPDFATNQLIYLSYAHGTPEANATRVARARFTGDALEDVAVIYTSAPTRDTLVHYGGRMAFLDDGTLLVTLGDGFDYREEAQKLDTEIGTIVRIGADGAIPSDNPFVDTPGARDAIWSYGHRNVQAIVVDRASGRVYAHEHGPRGGDEINIIEPGRNYGWPIITYGLDYSGALISPYTEREGMEQPLHQWTPSIAPAGMALYEGSAFAEWSGDLFVAALVTQSIHRMDLEDGAVVGEERLFSEFETRFRDVRQTPDGALLLLTDAPDGQVLRVTPATP